MNKVKFWDPILFAAVYIYNVSFVGDSCYARIGGWDQLKFREERFRIGDVQLDVRTGYNWT